MRLTAGTRLGPYEVLALLGTGGMAEVYRAKDTRLSRDVAIKVVSEALGADEAVLERFQREAKLAGSLNHPNIVALHDVGLHDGKPYFVTELLQGETLRQRLAKGPVPLAKALEWAAQMAQGLAAAHEMGIVHRDLKPENVFLTRDGHVKLLDFGIAKLIEAAYVPTPHSLLDETVSPSESKTGTGMVLGTPGYMSPEQVRGQPVDARTDLFSLGVVLYELLSGRRAFPGGSVVESGYAILHHEAEPLPAEVPAAVAQVVGRCLEKDPARRFQSARDLAFNLELLRTPTGPGTAAMPSPPRRRWRRWWWAALSVPAAGLVAAAFHFGAPGRRDSASSVAEQALRDGRSPGAKQPAIAVLPFVDMSPGKDQEYFSDGVSEELLNALSQVEGLRVAGRTSSFSFKGKGEDLRSIAQKLNVDSVLEGSVRKAGNHVRISAQLVNAADGYQLWAREFDREMSDILGVQAEIARAVVDALKIKLLHGAALAPEKQPRDPEAYRQVLLGRHFATSGDADVRARSAYEKAVTLDSEYAPAWAGLAHSLYAASLKSGTSAEMVADQRDALVAAERAVALDPNLSAGHLVRGWIRMHQWDFAGARSDFEGVLALNPRDPEAQQLYGSLLRRLGRLREGLDHVRIGTELDPLSETGWETLGDSLLEVGEFASARDAYRRALEISPSNDASRAGLVHADILEHQPAAALAAAEKLTAENDRLLYAAMAEYDLGRIPEAQKALDAYIAKFGAIDPTTVAAVYARRGERDRAFEWLDRAYAQHDDGLSEIARNVGLRALRGDPRFLALLKKMNLPLD